MEWYRLELVKLKDSSLRRVLERFNKYEDIFNLDKVYLKKCCNLSNEDVEKIYLSLDVDLDGELKKLKKMDISILFINDREYPEELRNIAKPPIFLYYRGDISLLSKKRIAVVGTRRATSYGKIACEKIVRELVENGITTVSGLASGIDSICHKKTLEFGGKTIAIVGSGLDVIYPQENKKLWEEISKTGLLISEYPVGTEPFAYNFPMRNRIIVGVSQGVVVVESKAKGGSLITAELALEEGREVFAIPGEIFSPASEGTNFLIKNASAKLVTSTDDILEEFGWNKIEESKKEKLKLTDYEKKIYNTLVREKNLDEIIEETSMKAGEVLSILMDLEVRKLITSVAGGKYRRKF
ncbi:DNA-processing protein DprA [Fusobacterium necrogenes]|uniref:DNA-processing protein DprA n=1 Tax=Fusobacterium necrogenes TaxID=858 RepID=UPI000E1B91F0|nr:DNA-processing protein DprA [Fusobacterium necrogenes]